MNLLLSKFKRWYKIDCMKAFYLRGSYELILEYFPVPFSMKRKEEVLCNIFRILALKKTEQVEWNDEFNYLINEEMLNVFNQDTQHYLQLFFVEQLSFTTETVDFKNIELSNVPNLIKKCFSVQLGVNK